MDTQLANFTDVLSGEDEIANSQPLSLPSSLELTEDIQVLQQKKSNDYNYSIFVRPEKGTGQCGAFRSVEEIDLKYRQVFTYPYFNLVQSSVIEDALYSDKSMVICAPTGSGKTVVFEMAIVQLLMELDDKNYTEDFKIVYMAPVKALCTERLSEWYPKFTKLGLNCIEVTGDTNVDFSQLKPYKVIITTPEKWDMLTRRWRDHRGLVEVIKLFLIDEVHILNDETRGPVLEAVVSRMKTIEDSSQSAHRIEQLQKQYVANPDPQTIKSSCKDSPPPRIRFVAVSATISNPEDVAAWLGTNDKPAVYYKFGDESRPVKLKRVVEGYPCPEGMSIFKFDIILNYKLWPIIQKYHDGKPTLIFCNTRKSVMLTAEALSRELTISFSAEQKAKLTAVAATIKNKKLQALVLSGVGCHHAGLLYEERLNIEQAFRNRDLPILITTTTLAMGVNLPAHLVIIKNTQQYVNGAYQEYSISTVLQMVGRAGRPQFDTEATAVIMTRLADKPRYQALVGGSEPLQSYLHKRLPENLNSEAALGTVGDVAQCVQWLRSTFLSVRAARDPKRYLGLPQNAPAHLITKKIEELCVKAMNGLATAGLITMDEACCIESTEAGRLMSVFYLDLETMKLIMKIEGNESLERLLWLICESHELADMHLRVDERRTLNALNRNNTAATIRFPMKGKISTRQMKLNCIIQAVFGCLPISEPALNQEAMKVMRIADRICKCLVAYVTRPDLITTQPQFFSTIVNTLTLAKCTAAHLWENSPYVSKQLKGIGPTFSTLLASAGKVNFTLLEESHPRDLERIMNKSAPAGNVLRKKVSLLPKYQLKATPIDEKRVSVQLMLLNQNHLAENMDQLTAGDAHKCYIVVGDSENHVLLFTSFKDRDLINVYDGILTYEITRKHDFEHNISVHCISSDWVGIDAKCDYVFKSVEPLFARGEAINPIPCHDTPRRPANKQTTITDVFKERKRRNNDTDITQSKEKKKRDYALIEKFKHLKNSFEITSKQLKEDLAKSAQMSDKMHDMALPDPIQLEKSRSPNKYLESSSNYNNYAETMINDNVLPNNNKLNNTGTLEAVMIQDNELGFAKMDLEDLDDEDNFEIDKRIDSILNEIESEIYEGKDLKNSSNNTNIGVNKRDNIITSDDASTKDRSFYNKDDIFYKPEVLNSGPSHFSKLYQYRMNPTRKRKLVNSKSNYSFLDSLEKRNNSNDEIPTSDKYGGFSDAIKAQIDQFLHRTTKIKTPEDIAIEGLINIDRTTENINSKEDMLKEATEKIDIRDTTSLILPSSVENPKVSFQQHKNINKSVDEINIKEQNTALVKEIEEGRDTANNNTTKNNFETNCSTECVLSTGATKTLSIKVNVEDNINNKELQINSNDKNSVNDAQMENNNNLVNSKSDRINAIEITEKGLPEETNVGTNNNKDDMTVVQDEVLIKYNEKEKENNEICTLHYFTTTETIKQDTTISNNNSNNKKDPSPISRYERKTFPCDNNILYETTIGKPTNDDNYDNEKCRAVNNTKNSMITVLNENNELSELSDYFNKVHQIPFENTFRLNSKELMPMCSNTLNSICIEYKQDISNCSTQITTKINTSLSTYPPNCEKSRTILYETPTKSTSMHDKINMEYINNYSLTATKIDFCTKDTPENQIKIIRKLKVDLDITEIILEENKCNKAETARSQPNTEDNNLHSLSSINLLEKKWYGSSNMESRTFNVQKSIFDGVNNKYESDEHKKCDAWNIHAPRHTTKAIMYEDKGREERESGNSNKENNHFQIIEPVFTRPSSYDRFPTPMQFDFTHIDKTTTEFANDAAIHRTVTNDKGNHLRVNEPQVQIEANRENKQSNITLDKIGNILQKYSAVLRKNGTTFNTDNINKDTNKNERKQVTEKTTKKPYKISNIHNVNIPLPKTLISAGASRNSMPASTYKDIRPKIQEVDRHKDNPDDFKPMAIPISPSNNDINVDFQNIEDTINIYKEKNLDNASPICEMLQLENLEDFNLDQSMFNPQTLLQQCYTKDKVEDIIPPPTEFCDEGVYSPTELDNELLNSIASQENTMKNNQDYNNSEFNLDRSIFEGDNFSVLTPSKEIETWTLSQDDGITHPNLYSSQISPIYQPRSCTVMRRNSPKMLSSQNFSSQTKLGQFKYMHKNKFKNK